MGANTVRVEWVRDQVFLLSDRSGFPLVMTQPEGVNGADLLPLSVVGCAVWDVMEILRKQRQPVSGVQVSAESVQDDQPPWRFRSIRIHYRFSGHGLDAVQLERAIALSQDKYCATYATMRDALELSSDFEIVDTQA